MEGAKGLADTAVVFGKVVTATAGAEVGGLDMTADWIAYGLDAAVVVNAMAGCMG
jgi:hypothetical protein